LLSSECFAILEYELTRLEEESRWLEKRRRVGLFMDSNGIEAVIDRLRRPSRIRKIL
jgi:hypothetical protein